MDDPSRAPLDDRAAQAQALRTVRIVALAGDAVALVVVWLVVAPTSTTVFLVAAAGIVLGAALVWLVLGRRIARLEDPAPAPLLLP